MRAELEKNRIMAKGRKALPDNAKRMKGTDQPCRLDDPGGQAMTLPVISKLPPARNLGKHGRKIYRQVGTMLMNLGILNEINFNHFYQYIRETELYISTMEEMPTAEEMIHDITDKQGNLTTKVKAMRNIAQDALNNSRSLGAEFGLTPQAQSKILGRLTKKESNPLDSFMNGR
jgi:P27 family predicted phage terminase small subunit